MAEPLVQYSSSIRKGSKVISASNLGAASEDNVSLQLEQVFEK